MASEIEGKVLKALAPIALKSEESGKQAQTYLHVFPEGEDATVIEVTDGRSCVRVQVPGGCDEGVLLRPQDAKRTQGSELLSIDGNHVLKPFRIDLDKDDGSTTDDLKWPDTEKARPGKGKALFAVSTKRLAAVLGALSKCGIATVEFVLPKQKGGAIEMRGSGAGEEGDERVEAEAAVMPSDMFGAVAEGGDSKAEA